MENYDNNGKTDTSDLMMIRIDPLDHLNLNGQLNTYNPTYYKENK